MNTIGFDISADIRFQRWSSQKSSFKLLNGNFFVATVTILLSCHRPRSPSVEDVLLVYVPVVFFVTLVGVLS